MNVSESNTSYGVQSYNTIRTPIDIDIRVIVISKANEKQFQIFIPTFCVICVLMTLGIPGNILALLVYIKRLKKAIARRFLMTLATCDLLTCAVVMPVELAMMTNFFQWDIDWLCKCFRLFSYSVSNVSNLTLLIIAVERYRLVCKPWTPKFSDSVSKRLCAANVVVSILTALPMFFMYGRKAIPLYKIQNATSNNSTMYSKMTPAVIIYGQSCLIDTNMEDSAFSFYVVIAYIVSIVLAFIILIALYSQVIRMLSKRRNKSLGQQDEKSKEASANRIRKITIMMVILTGLYEVCYLPCLSVVCLRLASPNIYHTFTQLGKTTFQLLLKSYLLCSAINPFVYCFCNKEFLSGLCWILRYVIQRTPKQETILQSQKLVTVSPSQNEIEYNNSLSSKEKTLDSEDLL